MKLTNKAKVTITTLGLAAVTVWGGAFYAYTNNGSNNSIVDSVKQEVSGWNTTASNYKEKYTKDVSNVNVLKVARAQGTFEELIDVMGNMSDYREFTSKGLELVSHLKRFDDMVIEKDRDNEYKLAAVEWSEDLATTITNMAKDAKHTDMNDFDVKMYAKKLNELRDQGNFLLGGQ